MEKTIHIRFVLPEIAMKLVLLLRQRRDLSVFAVISLLIAPVLCGQVGSIQANHSVRPVAASGLPLTQFARDQVDTERHAIRLLHRAHLQAELSTLEITWKQRWPSFLPSTLRQAHSALQELAFLVALETVDSDPRRPRVVQISMSPHAWFGIHVPGGRWGIDNPDTQYFLVPLEAGSAYTITGKRDAHGPVDSNFSLGSLDRWSTLRNIGHKQLHIAADGSYVITLDATPAHGRPNHIQLTPGADCLIIRNTLADWGSDTVDRLAVKRIAGPEPGPLPTDDALETIIVTRLHAVLDRVITNLQAPVLQQPVNVLPQPGKPGDKAGFLVTQRNALGHFRLGPDDAMVVTVQPGGAVYSTVPVTNIWGVTPDYWRRQSSLNNRQAIPNPDGTITVVVSGWDPSVANWVDTAGLEEGILMLRWQVLPDKANSAAEPAVRSIVVKRKDLAAALPPAMVTHTRAQREAQLDRRRAGFARRFANR
jgi:hypothetical protein